MYHHEQLTGSKGARWKLEDRKVGAASAIGDKAKTQAGDSGQP